MESHPFSPGLVGFVRMLDSMEALDGEKYPVPSFVPEATSAHHRERTKTVYYARPKGTIRVLVWAFGLHHVAHLTGYLLRDSLQAW